MAAKPKTNDPAKVDAYYEAMLKAKIKAGLSAEAAREVTLRQRAEDEENKLFPELEPTSEG